MKIRKETIIRKNLGFPSIFKAESDGGLILMNFRMGVLKIYLEDKLILETSKDQFDISGYLSDEDLLMILEREQLI